MLRRRSARSRSLRSSSPIALLYRALTEPAPPVAVVEHPQAIAAAQLGEVILAVQLVLPPAARHDVRPHDPHDRAVLEAGKPPAVVADLTRLRRQQLWLRVEPAHERPHQLWRRLRLHDMREPLPAKARLGQVAIAQHGAHNG